MEVPRTEGIREHFLIDIVRDHVDDVSIVFFDFFIVILLLAFFVGYFDATFSFPTAPLSLSWTSTS